MVRISIGDGWRADPEVRRALSAPGASRSEAVRAIVDVLTIEVDGVDIAAGRAEGPVAESAASLVSGLRRLAAGARQATVSFPDGAVDLVLRRQGGNALLSLVTLSRPARVLAHDVSVDLGALLDAAREASADWCRRVAEVSPAAASTPELRRILRASARAPRIAATAPAPSPGAPRSRRPARRPRAPVCSFELHDRDGRLSSWRGPGADLASLLVPGRVTIRSPGGQEWLSIPGIPFLSLRDLCAAADRIAAAGGRGKVAFSLARPGRQAPLRIEVDVGAGVLAAAGAPAVPCDPMPLARALLEGVADFCAVVASRAPAQADNAHLADLRESARAGLAHLAELERDEHSGPRRRLRGARARPAAHHPVSPGRLRRVSFDVAPLADLGPPARQPIDVEADGRHAVLCGEEHLVRFDLDGASVAWRAHGARMACQASDAVVVARAREVSSLEAASGQPRWSRPFPDGHRPTALIPVARSRVALVSADLVSALDVAGGRLAWSFEVPGARRLAAWRLGPLLVVAADTGVVQALDADGRVEWRVRGAGAPCAPPTAAAGRAHLLFRTPVGACLTTVDGASGRRLAEASLDLVPSGGAVPFSGRLAVAGTEGGDPVITAWDPDGTLAWTRSATPGAGPLALAPSAAGLLVKSADGGCALLDRDGAVRWVRQRPGALAAPGNLAPVAVRGLVLVPSDEVEVLDARDGRPVGRLPGPAPAFLHVTPELRVLLVDADGLASAARLRGHLSLVDGGDG